MADPTKILAYKKQLRDLTQQAYLEKLQSLNDTQAILSSLTAELSKASAELAELEHNEATIRKSLSSVPTKADGTKLLDALEETTVRERSQRAAILRCRNDLLTAESDAATTRADISVANAKLASAEAALTQATEASKQRDAWIKALGMAALTKLPADADNALKSKPFTDAEGRISEDIPEALRKRAHERRAAEAERMTEQISSRQAAEDAALLERSNNGGLAAKAQAQWTTFNRVASTAQQHVGNARGRFDQAQATLARVADPTQAQITDEQAARISDANLKAGREAAANEEQALQTKFDDWMKKQAELDAATLKAKAAGKDPSKEQEVKDAKKAASDAETAFRGSDSVWRAKENDLNTARSTVQTKQTAVDDAIQKARAAKKDPQADPDVAKARNELTQAETDLKTADAAYRESNRGILHAWEASIPDGTWNLFSDFEEATATLQQLKDTDPASLKTSLQTAEADYVKAQLAADASERVAAQLDAEQSRRATLEQTAIQTGAARLFSALRGDN